jgi:chlorite dismutase
MYVQKRTTRMTKIDPLASNAAHPHPERTWFSGSSLTGLWRVEDILHVKGEMMPSARYIDITNQPVSSSAQWSLSGVGSNLRYTSAAERAELNERQAALGREDARRAVLIPIRKSASWWAMAQDERHAIYSRSHHTDIGLDYLPAIARKLYHSRDLGEPFDFLTWFEFADDDATPFSELLGRLRATEEWTYVERETEIWLTRV